MGHMRLVIHISSLLFKRNLIAIFFSIRIAAPEAILEAAGGTLTDIQGNHYEYGHTVAYPNKLGVIATANNTNHQRVIDQLPDSVKQALQN